MIQIVVEKKFQRLCKNVRGNVLSLMLKRIILGDSLALTCGFAAIFVTLMLIVNQIYPIIFRHQISLKPGKNILNGHEVFPFT